jgi:uncharacterized protein YbaR (Trm112 family)
VEFISQEELQTKFKMLEILACPFDDFYPLDLHVFDEGKEIAAAIIICPKCSRWYPIRDKIPEMLPDELRDEKEEIRFLTKWKNVFPPHLAAESPFKLKLK